MATGLVIQSVANHSDGYRAEVDITGTPNGTLEFWASRTPDSSDAGQVPYTGTGPYYVQLGGQVLWYVWAKDSDGLTGEPGAVWIRESDDSDVSEIGTKLRDILWDNRAGIEAGWRSVYPDAKLKQVVFGFPADILEFPSIVVHKPRVSEEYAFIPYGRTVRYTFEVACLVFQSDNLNMLGMATQFMRAVQLILMQPAYETILLPNGICLGFAGAYQGESSEVEMDGIGFGAVSTLIWTADTTVQDPP